MERKKSNTTKPLWKKVTRGVLYLPINGVSRRIKPGEFVRASEDDLGKWSEEFESVSEENAPASVKETAKQVSKKPADADPTPEPAPEGYTVEHTGGGWYNVLSPEGKVMNSEKLRADDAEELKAQLEEESEE